MRPGSVNYNNWIETPIPMYLKFMMFNWTNVDDLNGDVDANYKPNLVEMGPYVFMEKHTRVNVSFHKENDTVSYDQIRTWHFMPEMSNGTLDDYVTNVNVIAAVSNSENYLNIETLNIKWCLTHISVSCILTSKLKILYQNGCKFYDETFQC